MSHRRALEAGGAQLRIDEARDRVPPSVHALGLADAQPSPSCGDSRRVSAIAKGHRLSRCPPATTARVEHRRDRDTLLNKGPLPMPSPGSRDQYDRNPVR